jgi:hypothetical protein
MVFISCFFLGTAPIFSNPKLCIFHWYCLHSRSDHLCICVYSIHLFFYSSLSQGTLGAGVYVLARGACKVEIQLEINVWNERAQCSERHTMAPLALFEVCTIMALCWNLHETGRTMFQQVTRLQNKIFKNKNRASPEDAKCSTLDHLVL